MKIIDRMLGRHPERALYEVPAGPQIEVAGVYHRRDIFGQLLGVHSEPLITEVRVTLVPEPGNRHDHNAVQVRLEDRHVGYLPREMAAAWSAPLSRGEAQGRRAHVTARIWYRWNKGYDEPVVYLRLNMARSPQHTERRAAGQCVECGRSLERSGKRGRPALRCPDCQAEQRRSET